MKSFYDIVSASILTLFCTCTCICVLIYLFDDDDDDDDDDDCPKYFSVMNFMQECEL